MHGNSDRTKGWPAVIGIYDPLSAMVAEQAGAKALWLSSYSYSVAQGLPDLGLLPFSAEQSALLRITSSVSVPVYVDIDNGLGSRRHAVNIAKRARDAGAAGVCIEDKMSPKVSSLYEGAQALLDIGVFADIVGAIKRDVPDLQVWARLEGLNYDESIATVRSKVRRCHDTGADCVIVHNVKPSVDDLLDVLAGHEGVQLGIIPTNFMSELPHFGDLDLHAVVLANQLLRAVYPIFGDTTRALLADPVGVERDVASIADINGLVHDGAGHGL